MLTIQGDKNLEGKKWKCNEIMNNVGDYTVHTDMRIELSRGEKLVILQQIQDDEIKVGDRVLLKDGLIYRALDTLDNQICILLEDGRKAWYPKHLFTKLQKPKEGDWYWIFHNSGSINESVWNNDEDDNKIWDFGFGFHSKEQAEFCRDRIKRVI